MQKEQFTCANLNSIRATSLDGIPPNLSFAKQMIYLDFVSHALPVTELISKPQLKVTNDPSHQEFINQARKEAKLSTCWADQVGAVVVDEGLILARGHNGPVISGDFCSVLQSDPNEIRSLLAEEESLSFCQAIHDVASIIAQAAAKGLALQNKSWYLSLEPCDNCANLLVVTSPKEVYFSHGLYRKAYYNSVGLERLLMARIPTFLVEND